MQTFLPYETYHLSAQVLDNKRLGKQRVETWQILNTLLGKSKGWGNHPAVKMWFGYETHLCRYGMFMCAEWTLRGYKDSLYEKFDNELNNMFSPPSEPWWLGDASFHESHRSNLLRKDPDWYSQFGWTDPHDLPYVWPTKHLIKP